jgi:DeoR/GlpR family transcriptional regulator of sugar metabolism
MARDLPLARRDIIAARLDEGRPVVAGALATEFGVSEDAIRRDLRALVAEGRARRAYGGALPITPGLANMAMRSGKQPEAKSRLGLAGAALIQPGDLVFLDNGSTNLALVEFLSEDLDLTVATNSVEIATAVLRRQDLPLIMIGGLADPVVGGCVDSSAVSAVSQIAIDICFVGACSVSASLGVRAFDHADALFKRSLVAGSTRTIVMATNDKFEERANFHVVNVADLHGLIVEEACDCPELAAIELAGCAVMRAKSTQ